MAAPTSIPVPDPPGLPRLRRALLAWYRRHRRRLPWRDAEDPYRVLVSEFMLQQTQVATALPYFDRFLARFPTLETLAAADEEDVRAAWSGLGYYRRARNLHAAAREMVRDHAGRLPADPGALAALPGVGDYTAAALASIVHGVPAAVLDGNVIRVLARLAGLAEPVNRTAVRRALQDLADRLLAPSAPGDWNQAVMELGALVCTPRGPACDRCPWRAGCRARAEGDPERYPVKDPARATVAVARGVGVLRRGERALLVRRRDEELLDGTWEFPGVEAGNSGDVQALLADHLRGFLGRPVRVGPEITRVRHAITHRRIIARAYAVSAESLPRARRGARAWVAAEEIGDYPTSSMTTKLFRALAAYFRSTTP